MITCRMCHTKVQTVCLLIALIQTATASIHELGIEPCYHVFYLICTYQTTRMPSDTAEQNLIRFLLPAHALRATRAVTVATIRLNTLIKHTTTNTSVALAGKIKPKTFGQCSKLA